MKFRPEFILFFALFFLIYTGINLYVYRLGRIIIKDDTIRIWYSVVFAVISLSYFFGRIAEKFSYDGFPAFFLTIIGSYWFAFMLYFTVGMLLIDTGSVISSIGQRFNFFRINWDAVRYYAAIGVWTVTILVVIGGSINAKYHKVRTIILESSTIDHDRKIAFVSDIHLGQIHNRKAAAILADSLNSLSPDMVIIGGDLFDEDLESVIRDGVGRILQTIKAPLGVYAITGNHEFFGGVEQAVSYMTENGITVLRDQKIDKAGIILVGREDIRGAQMNGKKRMSLPDILQDAQNGELIVIADHEPYKESVAESVAAGAFLHLAGHTHDGQMYPFNILVDRTFDLGYGFVKRGTMNLIVSCGYGTWGPPVRVGSRSEIVLIDIKKVK